MKLSAEQQAVIDHLNSAGPTARKDLKAAGLSLKAADQLVSGGLAVLVDGKYKAKESNRRKLTGRVTNATTGDGIGGATLDSGLEQASTSKDGTYMVVVEKGSTKVVKVTHPDYAPMAITSLWGEDGELLQAENHGVISAKPRDVALRLRGDEAAEEAAKKAEAERKAEAKALSAQEKAEKKEAEKKAKAEEREKALKEKAEKKEAEKKAKAEAKEAAKGQPKPGKEALPCLCNCGATAKPGANFLAGHDAKLHSLVLKVGRKAPGFDQGTIDALPERTREFIIRAPWATKSILASVGLGPDPQIEMATGAPEAEAAVAPAPEAEAAVAPAEAPTSPE